MEVVKTNKEILMNWGPENNHFRGIWPFFLRHLFEYLLWNEEKRKMKKFEYLTVLQNPAARSKRGITRSTLDTGRHQNKVKYLWNGWFLDLHLLRLCVCFSELYLPAKFVAIILKHTVYWANNEGIF